MLFRSDMTVELSGEEYHDFTVEMACDDEYGTVFTYNRVAGMLEEGISRKGIVMSMRLRSKETPLISTKQAV